MTNDAHRETQPSPTYVSERKTSSSDADYELALVQNNVTDFSLISQEKQLASVSLWLQYSAYNHGNLQARFVRKLATCLRKLFYRCTGKGKGMDSYIRGVFGKQIRKEFYFRDKAVYTNHGSYGTAPRRVLTHKMRLEEEMEMHADDWFRRKMHPIFHKALAAAAEFLHTDIDDTFFVQNATKGTNTVMKSYPLKQGDAILVTNLSYKAVLHTSRHIADINEGTEVTLLDMKFPITSEEEIVQLYEDILKRHGNIKLAVVDHITSSTALLVPVKKVVAVCHKYGVIVVIDGAHVPGQFPVNIPDIDADFYTGNFHKWLFAPKGCAVLWRNPERKHDWFRPMVTSNQHGCGLSKEFSYEGTKDDSPYLSLLEAIAFYEGIGGITAITEYNVDLRKRAVDHLVQCWGTRTLQVPASLQAPFMQLVKLPDIPGYGNSPEEAERCHMDMSAMFDVQSMVVSVQGELYVRVSTQVYNTIEDYQKLGQAVLRMTNWTKDE